MSVASAEHALMEGHTALTWGRVARVSLEAFWRPIKSQGIPKNRLS